MASTKIHWTDHSLGAAKMGLFGCSHVSPGCRNCWAEGMASRFREQWGIPDGIVHNGRWTGEIATDCTKIEPAFDSLPKRKPCRVFAPSSGDLFHPGVPLQFRIEVLDAMGSRPHLTFLVLTKQIESQLGIPSPHVYAYLGNAKEAFGRCALVLPQDALAGFVSPFDTGGLVEHIKPPCDWDDAKRREFLEQYTWPTTELPGLLEAYPGTNHSQQLAYIHGECPSASGFHDLWDGLPAAALWDENDEWRAWTWECRVPDILPVGEALFRWTCPPEMYAELQSHARSDPANKDAYLFLLRRYVRGGVARLVETLRRHQVTS